MRLLLTLLTFSMAAYEEAGAFVQKSIYKPNDPNETDFFSENSTLIWGILIGVMVVAFIVYFASRRNKKG